MLTGDLRHVPKMAVSPIIQVDSIQFSPFSFSCKLNRREVEEKETKGKQIRKRRKITR
jgi:hypothetical protein